MSEHLIRLNRLTEFARAQGWTDAELARRIERKQQQIRAWRTGDRRIGEGLARAIEELLGMERFHLDDRATAPLAHAMSEPTPPKYAGLPAHPLPSTTTARTVCVLPWHKLGEVLLLTDIERRQLPQLETYAPSSPAAVFVAMPDDSMEPRVRAGDHLLFDPLEAPRAGDLVLVADAAGEHFVRVFKPRNAHAWEGAPLNANYFGIGSAEAARVVAVGIEHRSYLRRDTTDR